MPPPGAFIDITSIPFSRTVTQAEFNAGTFGDVPNEVWFRYIAAAPIVLGRQVNDGGTFSPRNRIFESDGETGLESGDLIGTFGGWTVLASAGTYYIHIIRNGGGATDFDFTAEFDTTPLDDFTVEPGDYIINDDEDRPGTLSAADGTLKAFVSAVPGGEMGAMLPNGVSIWHDRYGHHGSDKLALLDTNLEYIGGANANLTGINFPKFATDATQFYVVNDSGELWTISPAGVEADTGYVFAGDLPQAFGVDALGTVLYWSSVDTDGVIHTVDLSDLSDGPDLYTIPGFESGTDKFARTANGHPGDLFVLDDESIVTWWFDDSELTYHVIHISAAGDLLHDISYEDPTQVDHLAQVYGQSAYVLIWLYTTIGFDIGHFGRLTFATGLITEDFTTPLFQGGVNMNGDTPLFGISTSCTMLAMGVPGSSSPGSPGSPGVIPDGEIGPIAWAEEWDEGA